MTDKIEVGDYIQCKLNGKVNVGCVVNKGEYHHQVAIYGMWGTYYIRVADESIVKLDPLEAFAILAKQQEQTS